MWLALEAHGRLLAVAGEQPGHDLVPGADRRRDGFLGAGLRPGPDVEPQVRSAYRQHDLDR